MAGRAMRCLTEAERLTGSIWGDSETTSLAAEAANEPREWMSASIWKDWAEMVNGGVEISEPLRVAIMSIESVSCHLLGEMMS